MTKTRLVSLIVATLVALGLLASFHTTASTSTRTAGRIHPAILACREVLERVAAERM